MKSCLLPAAISCLVASGLPCRADEVEDQLAEASTRIEFIAYDYAAIGRSGPMWLPESRQGKAWNALKDTLQLPASFEQLERLAGHANPRIRTLALMKLYALMEPDAFRVIGKHQGDTNETFPDLAPTHDGAIGDVATSSEPVIGKVVHTEKATISRVTGQMLRMIGYTSQRDGDFETWSKPRLGNPDWIAWYDFLYRIAIESSSPVPPQAAPRIAALKEKLKSRPAAVRAWLWFGIADDRLMVPAFDTPLATEAEMIEAARQLGPQALLAFLKDGTRAGLSEPHIDNPERGKRFILQHAKQLFREEDSKPLAESGNFIAAADANPKEASTLIRKIRLKDSDVGIAMAALLDHHGETETEFVVEWFHAPSGISGPAYDQSKFIHEYERRMPADWEKPIRALVAHPGFERLDRLNVAYFAQMVNKLAGKEIVSFDSTKGEVAQRNRLREHFSLAVPE
ncbi:hypothetical protein OKA05_20190 [Luteolibacter arcticus]|uniref:DUF4034 domain-containing protein n=1 Tax=Luteolibacter arcticus TaxID=1581411 RepID=A0ABT3GN21_9BACT|nr:hypothetical protein [Luteolibacter arcticus]MCW1924894.1 hypothetical protein [Luteolibacter arcticus]